MSFSNGLLALPDPVVRKDRRYMRRIVIVVADVTVTKF